MNKKLQVNQGAEGYDFSEIKQRFLDINNARLKRIDADLRTSQSDFLALLPLLFHVNHPLLPGYISKETPMGIPSYIPDENTLPWHSVFPGVLNIRKKPIVNLTLRPYI